METRAWYLEKAKTVTACKPRCCKNYLAGLQTLKRFQGRTFLGDIVRFEISLCDKKNSKPHDVSEVEKERDSEPTHTGKGK